MNKKTGRGSKPKRTVKRRSAAAASLADPRYRKRVVRSTRAYSRKGQGKTKSRDDEAEAES